ncbi:Uncharacterised protein [Achromobacter xylosoxidans]|nr:Uncharacterised protein [Achromobacter xylosoxidans]
MAGDRVDQLDRRVVAGVVALPLGFDEAVVDDFLVVLRGGQAAQRMRAAAHFGLREHLGARQRRHGGDVLEAVDACHFLDQVFLDLEVEAIRRRGDDEVVAIEREFQAQAAEDLCDFGLRDRHAQHAMAARQAHAHRLALGQVDDLVVQRTGLAAADVDDQARDEFDVLRNRGEVHAALAAVAGLGAELVAARAAGQRLRPPERGFQVDVLRVERDRRGLAPHDAGQAFDLVACHHHADLRIQRDGLAVQQFERLAFAGPAHRQVAMDLVQIEHVRGPAQFQHDVVGDVHQRRHRTLAGALQARLHPGGGLRARIHAADHAAAEAAAQVRRLDPDRTQLVQSHGHGLGGRHRQRRAGQRGHFARHAQDRQAVGAVGRHLQREERVVQVQRFADRLARRHIGRQLQQAGMVLRQAQFARRAQHARRLHAAHLGHADLHAAGQFRADAGQRHLQAGGRVGRAADDLQQRAGAVIDLADAQLVGVRVRGDLDDVRDHHARERGRGRHGVFDFQAGHGEPVREFIGCDRRIDQRTQPGFGKLHDQPSVIR